MCIPSCVYARAPAIFRITGPSMEEIDARVRARGPSRVRAQSIVSALREVREG
jgi:hypothetical protein